VHDGRGSHGVPNEVAATEPRGWRHTLTGGDVRAVTGRYAQARKKRQSPATLTFGLSGLCLKDCRHHPARRRSTTALWSLPVIHAITTIFLVGRCSISLSDTAIPMRHMPSYESDGRVMGPSHHQLPTEHCGSCDGDGVAMARRQRRARQRTAGWRVLPGGVTAWVRRGIYGRLHRKLKHRPYCVRDVWLCRLCGLTRRMA